MPRPPAPSSDPRREALRHAGEQARRRLWVDRLHHEYELLNHWYGLKLRPPILRVEPMGGRWGTWDPGARTITIAVELIECHRWDVVIEVLKHEIAHQLVSDTRGPAAPGTGRPHGPEFAAACERVRVADWARSASGALPTELPADPSSARLHALGEEEERLIRRAEKLLSLAGSSNEHEALLAMQRVQELYARHDLERLRARRSASVVTLTLHLGCRRVSRIESMILTILSEHFFVRVIHGRLYDAREGCDHATADLIGTSANVQMAEYVHGFLRQQVDTLWRDYRHRQAAGLAARRDYQLGVLSGFHAKLTEARDQLAAAGRETDPAPGETRALVALGQRELDAYVHHHYPSGIL